MPNPLQRMAPGRIAAIDYGTVRIGIAICDPERTLASPLESYTRRTPELDAKRLRQLAAEQRITLWVVGLPVHLDGRESKKSMEARGFGKWLADVTSVPVEFFDERFTSAEARDLLHQAEFTRKRHKQRIDMVAAQILLTAYLESTTKGEQPPGPLDDAGEFRV